MKTNRHPIIAVSLCLSALLTAFGTVGMAASSAPVNDSLNADLTAPELAWSIVPSPRKIGAASHLYGITALSATEAWAVGDRESDEGSPLIYHWSSGRWSELPAAPVPSSYLSDIVAISSNDIWAVGHQDNDGQADFSVTQHWDGVAWVQVASPNPSKDPFYGENYLAGVAAVASNDVWAVGYQETNTGYSELLIHWDGASWALFAPLPGGYRILRDVTALATNDVWAVGYSFTFKGGYQPLVMHWNGTQWADIAAPTTQDGYSFFYSVTAVSSSDIWAVGYGGIPAEPLTAHWDGSGWAFVSSPNFPNGYAFLQNVTSLASNDVWAVGYNLVGQSYQPLVEHWDGASWTTTTVPTVKHASNQLYGIASDKAGGLWVAGYYYPRDFSKPISTLILRGTP